MTSVLVRGMDMPKECRVCSLKEYNEHTGEMRCKPANVIISRNYKPIWFGGRPDDWCPLVEVKTPHGDLIDRDELFIPALSSSYDNEMVGDIISDAPTVVEAEDET